MQPLPLGRLRLATATATATALALVVFSTADSAVAQQFGRNSIRHQTFQFKVLRTEHFAITPGGNHPPLTQVPPPSAVNGSGVAHPVDDARSVQASRT